MAAIHHTGEKIARHAESDSARDLGFVATGQLALHYDIAAFGTCGPTPAGLVWATSRRR